MSAYTSVSGLKLVVYKALLYVLDARVERIGGGLREQDYICVRIYFYQYIRP